MAPQAQPNVSFPFVTKLSRPYDFPTSTSREPGLHSYYARLHGSVF